MNNILINNITYLNYLNSYFFYIESNQFYIASKSSYRKIKDSFKFLISVKESEVIKQISIFTYKKKHYKHPYFYFYNSLIERNKKIFLKESFYENKGRIKIIGRGWKIVKYPYELLVKLGYSHPLILSIHPFIEYKFKKKKKKILYFLW